MGAKKKRKRIQTLMNKGDGIVWDDLVLAGIGTLAKAAKKGKRKRFDRAVERGVKTLDLEIPELDDLVYDDTGDVGSDPVISYSPHGGGWYNIEIDNLIVGRVKGEEEAATRAGELLEAFASLDPEERDMETGSFHSGGGWYQLMVNGVPVDKVRGEEAANERYAEIEAFNVETTVDA
jgi:hypothetical protein